MTDFRSPPDDADQKYDRAKDDKCEMIAAAIEVAEADRDYWLLIRAKIACRKIIEESANPAAVDDAHREDERLQGE